MTGTTVAELLAAAHAAGVRLDASDGRIKLRGPAAAVQRLLPMVRERKPELLEALAEPVAAPAPGRTCRDCANRTRSGSCAEPVRAGLARRFSIVWPAPAHAARCAAYEARGAASGDGQSSAPGIGAAAPASAYWPPADAAELERMAQRTEQALKAGLTPHEAEALADALHQRDREGDDRRLCLECRHLRADDEGWRCASARGLRGPLARDLVVRLRHRCPGFEDR